MTTNAFLVYWCEEGLEAAVPITEYESIDAENTFRILNNQEPVRSPLNGIIQMMILRGQVNNQRNYELYAIDCDSDISKEDFEQWFNDNPQAAVDLIRAKGVRLFGHPAKEKRRVIV